MNSKIQDREHTKTLRANMVLAIVAFCSGHCSNLIGSDILFFIIFYLVWFEDKILSKTLLAPTQNSIQLSVKDN
jgi:hypothetical protein